MAQFVAFASGVSVNGQTVLAVVNGMGDFRPMALRLLAEQGIVNPVTEGWYPQQAYLNAYRQIAAALGPATLRRIGRQIPDNAAWPKDIQTIEQALRSIDLAYHLNHRGGEIGHYRYEATGPQSGRMVCINPYPCMFDLGIVEGVASKFAPPPMRVTVKHDEASPCRQQGGESCTHLISW